MAAIFEVAYLLGDNPRAQSGFGGDDARWEVARRPIATAIDRDGTFLDIGCASGYLMECLVRWTPHHIEPYGLDLTPAVADLARRRLPQWADRIFVGNAFTWQPPTRFDFVRTELEYVPEERQRAFLDRLLRRARALIRPRAGARARSRSAGGRRPDYRDRRPARCVTFTVCADATRDR